MPAPTRPVAQFAIKLYVPDELVDRVDAARARTCETRAGWLRRVVADAVDQDDDE